MRNLFTFHTDSGHGWVECTKSELIELGIADKISRYSYQNSEKVYCEEDCDGSLFFEAYEKKFNVKPVLKPVLKPVFTDSYKEESPIRRYDSYSPLV